MVSFEAIKDEYNRTIIEIFLGSNKEEVRNIEVAKLRLIFEQSDIVRVIDQSSGNIIAEFDRIKKPSPSP